MQAQGAALQRCGAGCARAMIAPQRGGTGWVCLLLLAKVVGDLEDRLALTCPGEEKKRSGHSVSCESSSFSSCVLMSRARVRGQGSGAPFPLPMLNAVWRFRSPARTAVGRVDDGGGRRGRRGAALGRLGRSMSRALSGSPLFLTSVPSDEALGWHKQGGKMANACAVRS